MRKFTRWAAVLPAVVVLGPNAWGQEIEVAELYFELNDTDGDLGIHGKVDGGPWTHARIKGPNGRQLLMTQVTGSLWQQQMTELFFESEEPPFDELTPEQFFDRFEAGTYQWRAWSRDTDLLAAETELTHAMPAPAEVTVNGEPMAMQCEEEEEGFDITDVTMPVTLDWEPVTMSHPDLGVQPPEEIEVVSYEIVVEAELERDGEEFVAIFSAFVPPEITSMTIPAEFLQLTEPYKYELIVREATHNQTAVESCFRIGG